MKATVTRADTRQVLADIDGAVRGVEMARTAAAVDRVLRSAAPSIWGNGGLDEAFDLAHSLCDELGLEPARWFHHASCHCGNHYLYASDSLGGLLDVRRPRHTERIAYAPGIVSPHLFEEVA